MNLLVVPDGHYYRTPNGDVYVESVFNYNFFTRYLTSFENVYVVGRISEITEVTNDMKVASGDNVYFLEMPSFKGPMNYLKNYFHIIKKAKKYSKEFECAIFRVPGATSNILAKEFMKTKKPFALEVVVDPWDYFKKGTIKSILRPIIRLHWTLFLKKICLKANGVSYVTKYYLQKKYPSKSIIDGESNDYFSSHYSSVTLDESTYTKDFKKYIGKKQYTLIHVANSFTTYGKGHITVMKAAKILLSQGYDIRVIFIGDGPLKNEFEQIAKELGLNNRIEFLGRLADGNEVREVMKTSDILVFPTKAEGLPRVVLEAMSVGLPCITSPVSGIPEIIKDSMLIKDDDYKEYARVMMQLFSNPAKLEELSRENIAIAHEFSSEKLNVRRTKFYNKLRKLAE